MTGFGEVGPLAGRPAYDLLVQAFSRLMAVTGEEGRPRVRMGVAVNDMGTGTWAAIGILGRPARAGPHRPRMPRPGIPVRDALAWM